MEIQGRTTKSRWTIKKMGESTSTQPCEKPNLHITNISKMNKNKCKNQKDPAQDNENNNLTDKQTNRQNMIISVKLSAEKIKTQI